MVGFWRRFAGLGKTHPLERQPAARPEVGGNPTGHARAHLHLLHLFLTPRPVTTITAPGWRERWEAVLGESPETAIDRLIKQGYLGAAPTEQVLSATVGVDQLKALLRDRGLRVSGRKGELLSRLMQADPETCARMAAGQGVLMCAAAGLDIASKYARDREINHELTVTATIAALQEGRLEEAVTHVAKHNADQVFVPGLGFDVRSLEELHRDLIRKIFDNPIPSIIGSVSHQDARALRVAASLLVMGLDKGAKAVASANAVGELRLGADTSVRMVMFSANHHRKLDQFKVAGITSVRVLSCHDACAACKAISRKLYTLRTLPELPFAKCTCDAGCRCLAQAEIE